VEAGNQTIHRIDSVVDAGAAFDVGFLTRRRHAMKAFFAVLMLTGSYLCAQTQGNQPVSQPGALPAMEQPAQQPAQQGPPEAQQPGTGALPAGSSNVAATLQVYAYPKANQTQDQQFQDETACYQWAQGQGAPSPDQGQQAAQQGQSKPGSGATVKGSAGGAATGAAIGAVAGDAGTGAAAGAIGGAAIGHRKKKKAQKETEKQQQQAQQAQQAQVTDNVKRAYSACMESRNYTVK
jgi:Glycine zipper